MNNWFHEIFFLLLQVEVDDDDEVMGDDDNDGFGPEIKLKSSNDVLDQVDKDTEEVLDFNFVSGSSANSTVLSKDPKDTVDGKGWIFLKSQFFDRFQQHLDFS